MLTSNKKKLCFVDSGGGNHSLLAVNKNNQHKLPCVSFKRNIQISRVHQSIILCDQTISGILPQITNDFHERQHDIEFES